MCHRGPFYVENRSGIGNTLGIPSGNGIEKIPPLRAKNELKEDLDRPLGIAGMEKFGSLSSDFQQGIWQYFASAGHG
jgi:hypothetical protein